MGKNTKRISHILNENGAGFFITVGESSEKVYLFLFSLFVITILSHKSYWNDTLMNAVYYVRFGLYALVNWGCAIYLFLLIAEWKQLWHSTVKLILTASVLFILTFIFSKIMTLESYSAVLGIYFGLLSYKKDYKKLLLILLSLTVAMLFLSWLGSVFGAAHDVSKYEREFGGHSFGMKYPNYWGYFALMSLLLFWYLFLQNKSLITFCVWWTISFFMWFVITSRTSALLGLAFPFFASVAEFFQKRRKQELHLAETIILVSLPFLVFTFTLILCWRMEWVRNTFYQTGFHTMAMRFVESGYALRNNGISLFGHDFRDFDPNLVDASYHITQIMDNAYVSDLILRGALWLGCCLSWLSFAHWRCLKEKDYRLLIISVFFLVLAMMERPALDVWFNFVLLYPLAKLPEKYDLESESLAIEET